MKNDVVIVGAGIVGLCSGLYLQEAGLEVTLVDKGEPGQATSYGNAGVISPWSCVPQAMPGIGRAIPGLLLKKNAPVSISARHAVKYIPWFLHFLRASTRDRAESNSAAMYQLCGDSVHLYKGLIASTGENSLLKDSLQIHAFRQASKANINSLSYTLRREKGARIELLNRAALRELEPMLAPDFQAAVVMPNMLRTTNPGRLCEVLSHRFKNDGGRFINGQVLELQRHDNEWRVLLQGQTLQAKKVVVTAGAWSTQLLEPLGVQMPLAAERGYHLWFDDTGIQINNSVMDMDAHVIASSMEQGIRIAGIAEFSDTDTPMSEANVAKMRRIASAMVPALADVPARQWMGVRPSFPDSLPVIESVIDQPGLIAAFGHSHYGLMMAPKTGQIVSQLVMGESPNINLSSFSSRRF